MTITISEVTQFGTISKIHINAAKAKIAMVRCYVTVRTSPRLPKKDSGTHQKKIVTMSTIGRRTQYLTLNLLSAIIGIFLNNQAFES